MNYDKYQEEIFAETAESWKLKELYAAIDNLKQQFGRRQLTSLEQAILRGILSGNSIEQIAKLLPEESYGSIVNSTWQLYRYVQALAKTKTHDINNYQNIPYLLEAAGYKKSSLPNPLEESAEQLLQGGKQSLTIISTDRFSRPTLAEQYDPDLNSTLDKVLIKREAQDNLVYTPVTPSKSEESALTVQKPVLPDSNVLSVVEADDFMPPISLWTKLGGMFMVSSVGVAIALSAFTPYNVTVKAQAKIRPAGELRIIEAETEGTVVDIAVKGNQKVNKGDIIATIDNSRLETQKSQLESNIQQATLQLQQIKAQIISQENRIEAETRGIKRTVASAKAQLSRSRREYQDRTQTANTEVEEAMANLNSTQEELKQAETELIALEADLKSAQANLKAAKSKSERYTLIAKSGALSQNQLEEAQLDVEQKEQAIISQQATIKRQNQEIIRRKQAVVAAQARLNNRQIALNPSDAEVAIALENIEREKAIGQATLSSLKREREALIQQQIEIQQQQARDRQELQQREQDLKRTTIKATADGILFKLNLRNPGQTVALGAEIAKIAPLDNSLVIQALVPAQEIDKVELNRPVQMKVSACPYPDYGTLKGVVSKIAPDSIAPQVNSTSSNSSTNLETGFYQVEIAPETLVLEKSNNQCAIQLGMEGTADIIAKEETALQFLLRKSRLMVDL